MNDTTSTGTKKGIKVLLTGLPRSGKTTIIKKVIPELKRDYQLYGFYTEEIVENNERVGFEIITVDGEREILAHKTKILSTIQLKSYRINLSGFEKVALESLKRGLARNIKNPLFIIDEIGKMELLSKEFRLLVTKLFDRPYNILATAPLRDLPFTRQLKKRSDLQIIEVTKKERDFLPERIINLFMQALYV